MESVSDHELLRRFAERGDERAFTELVERHLPAVRAHALARTNKADLADDLAQETFVLLAREASRIKASSVISGWLFLTVRHLAHKALRSECRRRKREHLFTTDLLMDAKHSDEPEIPYPALIEAMDHLRSHERDVLLLRYFENRSFKEIATTIGGSEESIRKCASRSLEKLHPLLARIGITSTAAALGTAMQAMAATSTPAGMACAISAKAIAASGAAATTLSLSTVTTLALMKSKAILTIAAVLAVVGTASYIVINREEKSSLPERASTQASSESPNASTSNAAATSKIDWSHRITALPSTSGQSSKESETRGEIGRMQNYYDNMIEESIEHYEARLEEARSPDFAAEKVQTNLEPLQKQLSLGENALKAVTDSLREFESQQICGELKPLLAEVERAHTYKKEILETVSAVISNLHSDGRLETRAVFEQISSTWSSEAKKEALDFLVKHSFISDFRNPPINLEYREDFMKANDWTEFPDAVASIRKVIPGDKLEKFDQFATNRRDILLEDRAFTRSQDLAKSLQLDAEQRNAIFQELLARKTEDPEKIKALLNETQAQDYK